MGDRLATIDIGLKVEGLLAAVPLSVGRAMSHFNTISHWTEAYLRTKWHLDPSNRLATIHQRFRQTGQTDRQTTVP